MDATLPNPSRALPHVPNGAATEQRDVNIRERALGFYSRWDAEGDGSSRRKFVHRCPGRVCSNGWVALPQRAVADADERTHAVADASSSSCKHDLRADKCADDSADARTHAAVDVRTHSSIGVVRRVGHSDDAHLCERFHLCRERDYA